MELISVIVPVYKVESYLEECVQSILKQSYKHLEIILVDDGSPDRCPQMCDDYLSLDDRIIVIHKKNGGLSDARNAGIDIAKGDFILFVDSDDYIAPQMIENLYNGIVMHDSEVEACKIYKLTENEICEYDREGNQIKDQTECLSGIDYLRLFISGQMENASWNKLYRRSCFTNIRFRLGRNNEDFLMLYELCKQINKIGFTDYFGYYYRQREGSIVHDTANFLYYDIIQNINDIKKDISVNMPTLKPVILNKEIQERITFMKLLLKRHKVIVHFREFSRNYLRLAKLPFTYANKLPINYRKPFYILKFCPFIYWFRS